MPVFRAPDPGTHVQGGGRSVSAARRASPGQAPRVPAKAECARSSAWRKSERTRLLREREALAPETLAELRSRIDHHLERAFPDLVHGILAFCWPYRNEYDSRHLAAALRRLGARTALPVVVAPRTPLIFREWKPGLELAVGPLAIPYPVGSPEVSPDHVLLPMLGWDADGYRLGYGGGFFDRTLAALAKRPRGIGIAYAQAFLHTLHPH